MHLSRSWMGLRQRMAFAVAACSNEDIPKGSVGTWAAAGQSGGTISTRHRRSAFKDSMLAPPLSRIASLLLRWAALKVSPKDSVARGPSRLAPATGECFQVNSCMCLSGPRSFDRRPAGRPTLSRLSRRKKWPQILTGFASAATVPLHGGRLRRRG